MTSEDKVTLYWTAGIVLGLAVVAAIAGLYFGWFDAPPAPQN